MEENNNSQTMVGSIEKLSLTEIKTEQAKMKFEETTDKIINDPNLAIKGLQYLKSHPEEYKDIFGTDLNIVE